jgi:MraZ protein
VTEEVIPKAIGHFRGRSEHALDGKGRLNIPARFRDVLRDQYQDERLMVTPWKKCLKVYPFAQWEQMELTLMRRLQEQTDMGKMIRYMIGGVEECGLDKQGRILLPAKMRADCAIQKDVVVSGVISYFEILAKATWEQDNLPTEVDFDNFEKSLMASGLM